MRMEGLEGKIVEAGKDKARVLRMLQELAQKNKKWILFGHITQSQEDDIRILEDKITVMSISYISTALEIEKDLRWHNSCKKCYFGRQFIDDCPISDYSQKFNLSRITGR